MKIDLHAGKSKKQSSCKHGPVSCLECGALIATPFKAEQGGSLGTWLKSIPREGTQRITVSIPLRRTEMGLLITVMLQQQATAEAVLAHLVEHSSEWDALVHQQAISGVYGTALPSQNGGAK